MSYVSIFLIYTFRSFFDANWAKGCANEVAAVAANWSAVSFALHGLGVFMIVTDFGLILPLVLGGWVGTYFSIKWRW